MHLMSEEELRAKVMMFQEWRTSSQAFNVIREGRTRKVVQPKTDGKLSSLEDF
jgi:hypothetical protein